jgi:hypothetical protein
MDEDPALIAAIAAEHHVDGDPGATDARYWWERVVTLKREVRRLRARLKQVDSEPDDVLDHVPGGKRK